MRIPGRYWWLFALTTCAIAALAIVAPVYFIGGPMTQDVAAGTYDSFNAMGDIVFGLVLALIFLAGAIYPGYSAAQILAHYRLRKRVINGELDAMPLAFPPIAPGELPDLSIAPLTLHWRARRDQPKFLKAFELVFTMLKITPALLILGLIAWNLALQPDKLAYIEANLFQFIAITAIFIAMLTLFIILVRIHRFQAKHSFGVTATPEGLESIDDSGLRAFIPWSEARLFEVESPSRFGPSVLRLLSSQDTAQWVHRILLDTYVPDGISFQEMRRREVALARVIIARTGLRPRTVTKRFMAPPAATMVAAHPL